MKIVYNLLLISLTLPTFSWTMQEVAARSIIEKANKDLQSISFDVNGVLVEKADTIRVMATALKENPYLIKTLPWALFHCLEIKNQVIRTDIHGVMDWLAERRPEFNRVTKTGQTVKERIIQLACARKRIEGTIDLMKDYHNKGYDIVIATNQDHRTVDYLIKNGTLPNIPYKLIFTYDSVEGKHLKKPDPEYFTEFKKALEANNLSCKRTLYIDDKLENIQAAEKSELKAMEFISPEFLHLDLAQKGLHFDQEMNKIFAIKN